MYAFIASLPPSFDDFISVFAAKIPRCFSAVFLLFYSQNYHLPQKNFPVMVDIFARVCYTISCTELIYLQEKAKIV